jgi:hypothetical protein
MCREVVISLIVFVISTCLSEGCTALLYARQIVWPHQTWLGSFCLFRFFLDSP